MKVGKKFKLRLERPGHIVVIDGATIWTYLPKHHQVQISDYVHNEEQFPSPHNIFKRYADEKTAKILGEEEINGVLCDVVSLVSGEDSDVSVTVWIDRKLNFPVKAIEETTTGYVVTHVLKDVRINDKIDDDLFTFVVPDGVDIVDMRE